MTLKVGEGEEQTVHHGRRGDGGTYLIVADDSEEFQVALRYAARLSEASRAHIGILSVTDVHDFQHWSNVESRMRRELREESEKFLWGIARKIYEVNRQISILYVREGSRKDQIVSVVDEDPSIRMLILGGSGGKNGPGPLVSYFTGKGMDRLRVPLVVVPGHLESQRIDQLT